MPLPPELASGQSTQIKPPAMVCTVYLAPWPVATAFPRKQWPSHAWGIGHCLHAEAARAGSWRTTSQLESHGGPRGDSSFLSCRSQPSVKSPSCAPVLCSCCDRWTRCCGCVGGIETPVFPGYGRYLIPRSVAGRLLVIPYTLVRARTPRGEQGLAPVACSYTPPCCLTAFPCLCPPMHPPTLLCSSQIGMPVLGILYTVWAKVSLRAVRRSHGTASAGAPLCWSRPLRLQSPLL